MCEQVFAFFAHEHETCLKINVLRTAVETESGDSYRLIVTRNS